MTLGAHLLASWLIANSFRLKQRERRLVALAGISPDLDGVGWLIDRANALVGIQTDFYFQYHHIIGHNLLASLVLATIVSYAATDRRRLTWVLAVTVVHLHLLGDLMGSKGPDGYQWPITWLAPFNHTWLWTWQGQWELHAWQNTVITLSMLSIAMFWGWWRNYSFIEVFSSRLDLAFFAMLKRYNLTRRLPHGTTQP